MMILKTLQAKSLETALLYLRLRNKEWTELSQDYQRPIEGRQADETAGWGWDKDEQHAETSYFRMSKMDLGFWTW